MDSFLHAVAGLLGAYARQVFLVLGPVAGLGALLFFVIRHTQALFQQAFGWKAVVYTTGWLGTPVHELSHALVGTLFGIKIDEVKLFDPDPNTGVLGYVRYQVPRKRWQELPQLVGTFFMGIAPLLVGAGLISLAFVLLVQPEVDGRYQVAFGQLSGFVVAGDLRPAGQALGGLVRALFSEIFEPGWQRAWQTWAFLYLALAIGAHLAPSRADLRGGWAGFVALLGLGLVANVVALALQLDPSAATAALQEALGPLACLLFLVLLLNVGWLAVAQVLTLALARRH